MSVKEDWRRVQTVSDETLEENWKLMFGDKEQPIERLVLTTTFLGVERKLSAKLPLDFSNCGSIEEIEEKIKKRISNENNSGLTRI